MRISFLVKSRSMEAHTWGQFICLGGLCWAILNLFISIIATIRLWRMLIQDEGSRYLTVAVAVFALASGSVRGGIVGFAIWKFEEVLQVRTKVVIRMIVGT